MMLLRKLIFFFGEPNLNIDIHMSAAIRMLRITWHGELRPGLLDQLLTKPLTIRPHLEQDAVRLPFFANGPAFAKRIIRERNDVFLRLPAAFLARGPPPGPFGLGIVTFSGMRTAPAFLTTRQDLSELIGDPAFASAPLRFLAFIVHHIIVSAERRASFHPIPLLPSGNILNILNVIAAVLLAILQVLSHTLVG